MSHGLVLSIEFSKTVAIIFQAYYDPINPIITHDNHTIDIRCASFVYGTFLFPKKRQALRPAVAGRPSEKVVAVAENE